MVVKWVPAPKGGNDLGQAVRSRMDVRCTGVCVMYGSTAGVLGLSRLVVSGWPKVVSGGTDVDAGVHRDSLSPRRLLRQKASQHHRTEVVALASP